MNAQQESSVFLLENDQNIASAISSLCQKGHVRLHHFQYWEDMDDQLHGCTPDCIIMSESINNCHDTSERISHITSHCAEMPVIVLGQQHNLTGAVAAIQAGALDYIEKPAITGRLAAHMSRLKACNQANH